MKALNAFRALQEAQEGDAVVSLNDPANLSTEDARLVRLATEVNGLTTMLTGVAMPDGRLFKFKPSTSLSESRRMRTLAVRKAEGVPVRVDSGAVVHYTNPKNGLERPIGNLYDYRTNGFNPNPYFDDNSEEYVARAFNPVALVTESRTTGELSLTQFGTNLMVELTKDEAIRDPEVFAEAAQYLPALFRGEFSFDAETGELTGHSVEAIEFIESVEAAILIKAGPAIEAAEAEAAAKAEAEAKAAAEAEAEAEGEGVDEEQDEQEEDEEEEYLEV